MILGYYILLVFLVILLFLFSQYIFWEISRRIKENKIKIDPNITDEDKEKEINKIKKETADKFKFGLDKHSYIISIINLIIATIAIMTLIQSILWNRETAILNNKSFQTLQEILNKTVKYQ